MKLCDSIQRLATALRESRAREVAEPYRHALEQRLICSNLPLLTGNADADLMRFVFHEQEIAGYFCGQLEKDLAAAIARAEKAEAERDEERAAHDAVASICHEAGVDGGDGTSISLVRALKADLAAARAELARLGPVEWEASSGNGWGHVTESTRARCQGLPGWEFRAIRVVKEAQ